MEHGCQMMPSNMLHKTEHAM